MLLSPAVPAAAEPTPTGGATRCEVNVICTGTEDPGTKPTPGGGGTGGTGGSSSGPQVCTWNGQPLACSDPVLGWFSASTGCYYRILSPQPAEGDPAWEGHKPSDGAVYNATCRYPDNSGQSPTLPRFFAQAPAGPPPDNPAQLARQARDRIAFPKPKPGTAPKGDSVVGAPLWLWLENAQAPAPVSVSGNTLTVTVTPRLDWVEWKFGDGTKERCAGKAAAGTPYDPKYGNSPSPTCGHVFTSGSGTKKDGLFHGTVTAQWVGVVTVTGGTQRVDPIELPLTETLQFRVAEVQVLN
ncbi:hypothetical protein [Kitasatospora sp. NBC_00458]|uniref:hypothetical protein n=1 Tax=Kitasatospora sp. NBC_00458 TaxID=2903568 RepID=UPI002E18171A